MRAAFSLTGSEHLLILFRAGCLALQGAFAEHQVMLQKLSLKRKVVIVLVRQPEDLDKCDALIIPGGGASLVYHYIYIYCVI